MRQNLVEHAQAFEESRFDGTRAMLKQWTETVVSGRIEQVPGLYAPDAILVPALSNEIIVTEDGRRRYFEFFLSDGGVHCAVEPEEFRIDRAGDNPLSERKFHRFLSLLQSSAGQRLLRVKGIIATEDFPEEPLIVNAVQHTVSNPVRLPAWPDDDRRTRLVFITDGIDPEPVRELFTALIDTVPFSFTKSLGNDGEVLMTTLSRTFSSLTNISRRSQ